MKFLSMIVAVAMLVVLAGCSGMTKTQKGAVLGAGTGALAGQLIGGDTTGTLIGAGVGGVAGALGGDYLEKKENQDRYVGYNQGYQQGYNQGYNAPTQPPQQQPNYYSQEPPRSTW